MNELTRPTPPKARLRCDACGTIGEDRKHNSVICRFFQWLDKTFRSRRMIDENGYEWEVYYNGVLLGRTNTEGRHQLVKEKVEHPIGIPEIEFKLVLKQHFGVEE